MSNLFKGPEQDKTWDKTLNLSWEMHWWTKHITLDFS